MMNFKRQKEYAMYEREELVKMINYNRSVIRDYSFLNKGQKYNIRVALDRKNNDRIKTTQYNSTATYLTHWVNNAEFLYMNDNLLFFRVDAGYIVSFFRNRDITVILDTDGNFLTKNVKKINIKSAASNMHKRFNSNNK